MRVLARSQFSSRSGDFQFTKQFFLDACLTQFSTEACNLPNLFAMTVGGLSFSVARMASNPLASLVPSFLRNPLRNAFALIAEVAAFRSVSQGLNTDFQEAILDSQAFLRDYLNFSCLKGVGFFLSTSNPCLRHFSQNIAMIAAEECTAVAGFTPRNESSFAEKFVHASATNLALEVGGRIFCGLTGAKLRALESSFQRNESVARVEDPPLQLRLPRYAGEGSVYHPHQADKAFLIDGLIQTFILAPAFEKTFFLKQIGLYPDAFFAQLRIAPERIEGLFSEISHAAKMEGDELLFFHVHVLLRKYFLNPENLLTPRLEALVGDMVGCHSDVLRVSSAKRDLLQCLFDRKMRSSEFQPNTERFWNFLGVRQVNFGDRQFALSTIPHFLMRHYRRPPPQSPLPTLTRGAPMRRIKKNDFLAEQGIDERDYVASKHRSLIYRIENGQRILVLKETKSPGQYQEVEMQLALERAGLKGIFPTPVQREEKCFLVQEENGNRTWMAYKADPRYFHYLDDVELPWHDFEQGVLRSAHGIGVLARHGLYQTEPLALYHHRDAEASASRRYLVFPEFTLPEVAVGMGVIDNYRASLSFCNYSVPGSRDAESVFRLSEIYENRNLREFGSLKSRSNHAALAEALLVGDNLLGLSLLIGHRMASEIAHLRNRERIILSDEEGRLERYRSLSLRAYAGYYAARHRLSLSQALSVIMGRCDWLRLMRQSAFFMTSTYQPYVSLGGELEGLAEYSRPAAFEALYGSDVQVRVVGPYRNEQTREAIPHWPPEDLGAANGAFPITEFQKALCAVLFGPSMEEMQD